MTNPKAGQPDMVEVVAWKTPYFESGRNGTLLPVFVSGDASPSDETWEPLVRLSDYQTLQAERDAMREALEEFGTSRVRDRVAKYVGCNHDLLHDALQQEVKTAIELISLEQWLDNIQPQGDK